VSAGTSVAPGGERLVNGRIAGFFGSPADADVAAADTAGVIPVPGADAGLSGDVTTVSSLSSELRLPRRSRDDGSDCAPGEVVVAAAAAAAALAADKNEDASGDSGGARGEAPRSALAPPLLPLPAPGVDGGALSPSGTSDTRDSLRPPSSADPGSALSPSPSRGLIDTPRYAPPAAADALVVADADVDTDMPGPARRGGERADALEPLWRGGDPGPGPGPVCCSHGCSSNASAVLRIAGSF